MVRLPELMMILEFHRQGSSIADIARRTGRDRKTVRKHIKQRGEGPIYGPRASRPPAKLSPFMEFLRERITTFPDLSAARLTREIRGMGYVGGYTMVKRFLAEILPNKREHACQAAFGWMRAVLQKDVNLDALRREMVGVPDVEVLVDRLYHGSLAARNRAMVILADHHGLKSGTVCAFLGIDRQTQRKYLRNFESGGHIALFARQTRSIRKHDDWALRQAVFRILHEPPANYGINRTTWIMRDLSRILRDAGRPACPAVIRKIIKSAGYRWRKARKVLTSNDPDYREKVRHIQKVLSGLKDSEAFFSVDEFGPFSIRAYGGRARVGPNEVHTVRVRSEGTRVETAQTRPVCAPGVPQFFPATSGLSVKLLKPLVGAVGIEPTTPPV